MRGALLRCAFGTRCPFGPRRTLRALGTRLTLGTRSSFRSRPALSARRARLARRTRFLRLLQLRLLRLLLFGTARFRRGPCTTAATAAATAFAPPALQFRRQGLLRAWRLLSGRTLLPFGPGSLVLTLGLLRAVLTALLFLLLPALALPLLRLLLPATCALFALSAAALLFANAPGPLFELADLLFHVAAREVRVFGPEKIVTAIRAALPPLGVGLFAAGADD